MEMITLRSVEAVHAVKHLMAAVERGRSFVNGNETFRLSKRKGRKLAYRWRGNRRGRRIAEWLARSKLPVGMTLELPVEVQILSSFRSLQDNLKIARTSPSRSHHLRG